MDDQTDSSGKFCGFMTDCNASYLANGQSNVYKRLFTHEWMPEMNHPLGVMWGGVSKPKA